MHMKRAYKEVTESWHTQSTGAQTTTTPVCLFPLDVEWRLTFSQLHVTSVSVDQ